MGAGCPGCPTPLTRSAEPKPFLGVTTSHMTVTPARRGIRGFITVLDWSQGNLGGCTEALRRAGRLGHMSSGKPPELSLTPPGPSLSLIWGNQGTERALCPGSHRELVADQGQDPRPPTPGWVNSGHKCSSPPSGDSVPISVPLLLPERGSWHRGPNTLSHMQACRAPGSRHP